MIAIIPSSLKIRLTSISEIFRARLVIKHFSKNMGVEIFLRNHYATTFVKPLMQTDASTANFENRGVSSNEFYNSLFYNEHFKDRNLSAQELDQYFQSKQSVFIYLSELVKLNRPRLSYSLLCHFVKNDLIDRKSIYPAAKLLALIRVAKTNVIVDEAQFVAIHNYLRVQALQMNDSTVLRNIVCTINFLLDICQDKFEMLMNDNIICHLLDRSDCFHLASGIAFNARNWDVLELICNKLASDDTFFSHKIFPVIDKLMDFLKTSTQAPLADSSTDRVMRIFMNQLAASKYYLTYDEFHQFIEPALREFAQWNWQPARPTLVKSHEQKNILIRCDQCSGVIMKQRTLTEKEHKALRDAFNTSIDERVQTGRIASVKEFTNLGKLIHKIEVENVGLKSSTPLVVDGLNALHLNAGVRAQHSVFKPLNFTTLYNLILKLLNRKYGPVLVIYRHSRNSSEFLQKLRVINVYSFQCDKRSQDDAFIIRAALAMGQRTQIMTNDLLEDWRGELLPKDRELFDVWYRSKCITFHNGQYEIPSEYERCVQKSADGYHVSVMGRVAGENWFRPRTFCIRSRNNIKNIKVSGPNV